MNITFIIEGDSDKIILNSIKNRLSQYDVKIDFIVTNGRPNMLKKAEKFIKVAKYLYKADYIFLLPDLDNDKCPIELIKKMNIKDKTNLFINVIVREIEAWLLADSSCIRDSLNINYHPSGYTDNVVDPKQRLNNLVFKAFGHYFSDIERAKFFSGYFSFDRSVLHNNSVSRFVKIFDSLISK